MHSKLCPENQAQTLSECTLSDAAYIRRLSASDEFSRGNALYDLGKGLVLQIMQEEEEDSSIMMSFKIN